MGDLATQCGSADGTFAQLGAFDVLIIVPVEQTRSSDPNARVPPSAGRFKFDGIGNSRIASFNVPRNGSD
jgi:hypothetical protein